MLARKALLAREGVLRGVDGRHQLLLDPLAVGHVHHRAQRAHDAPRRGAEGGGRDLGPEAAAVLALKGELVLLGQSLQPEEHVLAIGGLLVLGHEEGGHGDPHHLAPRCTRRAGSSASSRRR
jgi:hypothetical protein